MNRALKQLKRDLLADKRKLGLGVTLVAVALLLWGRLLLKDVPRTAVADPKPDRQANASTPPEAAPTPAPGPVGQQPPEVVLEPPRPGARDLFAWQPRFYPGAFAEPENDESSQKSGSDSADQDQQRRQLRRAVLAEAASLNLQSTMLGDRSRAVIGGVLLETGQSIRGFELVEVRPRQVTLVKHGVKVTLEM